MLWLIDASSCHDADHGWRLMNPPKGGGPVVCVGSACVGTMFEFGAKNGGGGLEKSISATYFGAGFLVDLGGFEFPGSRFGDGA